jgi:hypothetical protein
VYSDSQLRKNAKIDAYKCFCDAILSVDAGGKLHPHLS